MLGDSLSLRGAFIKLIFGGQSAPLLIATFVLGLALGFIPNSLTAIGLVLLISTLTLLLNLNLPLFALAVLLGKLLTLVLLPLSFELGRLIIEGPLRGLIQFLVNAPVTAYFGFEYYTVTGGLVLAIPFGVALGLLTHRGLSTFRNKLIRLENDSEGLRQFMAKRGVRILLWMMVGKRLKKGFAAAFSKKPLLFRLAGLVPVVVLLVAGSVALVYVNGPVAAGVIRSVAAQANGATVDLDSVELNPAAGTAELRGLAVADPNKLTHDVFKAERLLLDVSLSDLLRKRISIDEVVATSASIGYPRAVAGERIGAQPKPRDIQIPTGAEMEAYVQSAQVWKERLAQAKSWIDKLSQPKPEVETATVEETTSNFESWLDAQIDREGYARMKDASLVQKTPSIHVAKVRVERAKIAYFPEETVDLDIEHVSSQPWLIDAVPVVRAQSSQNSLSLDLRLATATQQGGDSTLNLQIRNLDAAAVIAQMVPQIQEKVSGGILDFSTVGSLKDQGGAWLDLEVDAQMKDTEVRIGGDPVKIARFNIPFTLQGAMDNPGISVDQEKLNAALADAAAAIAEQKAKSAITKKINEKLGGALSPEATERVGEILDGIGSGLRGLFGK